MLHQTDHDASRGEAMRDDALVTRHGAANLPHGTADRPLMTLAIFTYNQEQFIREAIEGAFAQTYTPLEIILSDDCSADATPTILEEMAAAYRGPHRVIVRRGQRNVGTLAHVLHAARLASSEIFVVAAGDDVSLPQRIDRIAALMSDTRASAFSSDEINIDAHGNRSPIDPEDVAGRDELHRGNRAWVHGATAAYRLRFLAGFPIPDRPILYEDMIFRDILSLAGGQAIRSRECMILYRQHQQNLYNRTTTSAEDERLYQLKNWQRLAVSYGYILRHAITVVRKSGASPARLARSVIAMRKRILPYIYFSILARIETAGPGSRILLLAVAALINRPDNDAYRTAQRAVAYRKAGASLPARTP